MQIFRVTVRGRFVDLDDEQRARLRADAGAHDLVESGGFSDAGALSYDRALHAFSYRVQLRTKGDEGEAEVTERALAQAAAELDRLGVAYERLRAQATDMAAMWADRA
jgi:hypothetical protein